MTKVFDEFCATNQKYWSEKPFNPESQTILVEGFFAEAGSNYVIRIGSISKEMEAMKDANLLVLLEFDKKDEPNKAQIWQSFGMNNFVGIKQISDGFSRLKRLKVKFFAAKCYFVCKFLIATNQQKCFFNLKHQNIKFGDLLFDELVKVSADLTLKSISKKHKFLFKRVFLYFSALEEIYKKHRPTLYVTTHTQYVTYGLPARFLAAKGCSVIETTDYYLSVFNSKILPKFHARIKEEIRAKIVGRTSPTTSTVEQLEKRFAGKTEQIDVQMAYAGKQKYSALELRQKLGIKNQNPIVFVFAHVFADAPQGLSDGMLFPDFYSWLVETIKFAKDVRHVNWVIKEHPSSKAYSEVGTVKSLINQFSSDSSTVYACPDDFNTASVLSCATAIVTAQGTAGLEFACMGIPALLASEPFYSDFGFTNRPDCQTKYFNSLKQIGQISKLSRDQINKARLVYECFLECTIEDLSLIDTELKNKTWGVNCEKDILGAFKLMTERLKKINPTNNQYVQLLKTKLMTKIIITKKGSEKTMAFKSLEAARTALAQWHQLYYFSKNQVEPVLENTDHATFGECEYKIVAN